MNIFLSFRLCAVLLVITLCHADAEAQLLMRRHARKNEPAPGAILVQLPTYQRRIDYLQRPKDSAKLQQVKRDADSMQAKMVLDFSDNIDYCPVYFFYDSDIEKIKNKQLNGVLLNSNLRPVQPSSVTAIGKNYFIVLFGLVYEETTGESEGSLSAGQSVASSKQRLQVYDSDYQKVKKPLPSGTNNVWAKPKRDISAYQYESPLFNIYYHPYAARFNAKLHVFYGSSSK